MAETKQQKLNRIPAGSISQQPLPPWPRLPRFLYDKFPQHREELDAYNAAVEDYFVKRVTRGS